MAVLDWAVLSTGVWLLSSAGYLLGAIGAAGLLVSRLSDRRFRSTTTLPLRVGDEPP